MSINFETFKALHHTPAPFILPNAWDAKSASLFEQNNFKAVGTSSAAVAESLGYTDGEGMPFQEYLLVVQRIVSAVKIPVTIDMEMGYGKTKEQIVENLFRLAELGIAGINLEDSIIHNNVRLLQNSADFANLLTYIKSKLAVNNQLLFINVRCDTYILNVPDKMKETAKRLQQYEAAGADGIFLPCISNEKDIADAVANTKLPLNVMCIPGLPEFSVLEKLGVKRISMGPFFFNKVYQSIQTLSENIISQKSFSSII